MNNNDRLPPHLASLVNDLESDDEEIRKVAAIKLSELRDPRVLDRLQEKQDDPDELVRYFLVKAVKETVRDKQVREAVRVFGRGDPSLEQPGARTPPRRNRPVISAEDRILLATKSRHRGGAPPVPESRDDGARHGTVPETRKFPWYAHLFFVLVVITAAVLIPKQDAPDSTSVNHESAESDGADAAEAVPYAMPDPGQVFQLAEEGLEALKTGMEPGAVSELTAAAGILREMKQRAAPEELPEKFYFYYYLCLSDAGQDLKAARDLVQYLERFYMRGREEVMLERALAHMIVFHFNKTREDKKISAKLLPYIREYRRKYPLGSTHKEVDRITAHLVKIGVVAVEDL